MIWPARRAALMAMFRAGCILKELAAKPTDDCLPAALQQIYKALILL